MNNLDTEIEKEIIEKGLTAPRITLKDLEDNITDIDIVKFITKSGKILRWAVLTTKNGYAVTGNPSAAVSPQNDNSEIGEKIAIDNAKSELWGLMGYSLSDRLYNKK